MCAAKKRQTATRSPATLNVDSGSMASLVARSPNSGMPVGQQWTPTAILRTHPRADVFRIFLSWLFCWGTLGRLRSAFVRCLGLELDVFQEALSEPIRQKQAARSERPQGFAQFGNRL
jgi:hypothetical protein